jgi:hypothetical protein
LHSFLCSYCVIFLQFFLAPATAVGALSARQPFLPAPEPAVLSQASAAAVPTATPMFLTILSKTWPLLGSGFPDGALPMLRLAGAWQVVAIGSILLAPSSLVFSRDS